LLNAFGQAVRLITSRGQLRLFVMANTSGKSSKESQRPALVYWLADLRPSIILTTIDHCKCGDVTSQSQKNHENQQRLQIENQDNKDGYNSNRCCDPNFPRKELLKHGSHTLLLFSPASSPRHYISTK
jgi:hypothetical protein